MHKKIKTNQATYTLIRLTMHHIYCLNSCFFFFHSYPRNSSSHRIYFISKLFLHQPKQFIPLYIRINIRALKKYAKPRNIGLKPKKIQRTRKKNNKFERISHLFLNHFIVNCNIPASFLLFKTIMKEKRHSRRNR